MEYSYIEVEKQINERLNETKQYKIILKNELELIDNKIKSLYLHIGTRPRLTDEQIINKIQQIEYIHSTTPQTNLDERNFMREIDKLKKQRKELVEYNTLQNSIDELKQRRTLLLKDLKEKEIYIDELYQGSRKLRVSTRLGCEPSSLTEETILIPDDKIAHVIGKNGLSIKNLENDCCVGIDVEKINGNNQLRITGLPGGVAIALDQVTLKLNTTTELRLLSEPLLICLLKDKAQLLQDIQERYHVRMDVSRSTKECKITGLINDVQLALNEIQSIDAISDQFKLDPTILPFLMGKGGAILRALQTEYSIQLDINRDDLIVKLIGLKSNVINAKNSLIGIINDNKEIEDSFTCERFALIDVIIGIKGSLVRQLQKDYNVGIILEKNDQINQKLTSESKLEIEKVILKGTTSKVLVAKQHLLDLINDYNLNTEYISIPQNSIPYILGKNGSNIKKLRDQFPNISIDMIIKLSSLRVHSYDTTKRTQIKNIVNDIIINNSQYDYKTTKNICNLLKTERGTSLRNYLSNDVKIIFDIDSDNEIIKFRGHSDKFPLAITALDKYSDDNFILENVYSSEDFNSFLSNIRSTSKDNVKNQKNQKQNNTNQKQNNNNNNNNDITTSNLDETLLRKIENDYNVRLSLIRKQNLVRISGHKLSVLAADDAINHILHGDSTTGESILLFMNKLAIGALIGKGGKNIQEFERKYHVCIDILSSREQVRVRGTPEAVNEAIKGLLKFIDKLRLSIPLNLKKKSTKNEQNKTNGHNSNDNDNNGGDDNNDNDNDESKTNGNHNDNNNNNDNDDDNNDIEPNYTKEQLKEISINANKYYGTDVIIQQDNSGFVLQGTKKQIDYTKKYITDSLSGISEVEIPILQHHYDHFMNSSSSVEKLLQYRRTFNINITLSPLKVKFSEDRYINHNFVIILQGQIQVLTKATINVYRLLDYLFPAEFISIPIDNYILRSIWSNSLISYEIFKLYSNVSISYDMIMSCARIVGSDSIAAHQAMNYINDLLTSYVSLDIDRAILPIILSQKNLISANITKNTTITIQFPTEQKLTFYLHGSDTIIALNAKEKLIALIQKIIKENWQTSLNPDMIGSMIGKNGANLQKLRTETNANVEVDINTRIVKVTGKEEYVTNAKNIILQMIADKEAEKYEQRLSISRECIPVIIGSKGETIRTIKQNSGVISIDIDRKTNQYIILKGRSEACNKATTEIQKVITDAGINFSVLATPSLSSSSNKNNVIEETKEVSSNEPVVPRKVPGSETLSGPPIVIEWGKKSRRKQKILDEMDDKNDDDIDKKPSAIETFTSNNTSEVSLNGSASYTNHSNITTTSSSSISSKFSSLLLSSSSSTTSLSTITSSLSPSTTTLTPSPTSSTSSLLTTNPALSHLVHNPISASAESTTTTSTTSSSTKSSISNDLSGDLLSLLLSPDITPSTLNHNNSNISLSTPTLTTQNHLQTPQVEKLNSNASLNNPSTQTSYFKSKSGLKIRLE